MHLVEQYALSCGIKIDKPHIETSFFPVPFEKYITLHASSGMSSKNYDYFQDVIEMIFPYLAQNKINILQIGAKEDAKMPFCTHYNGVTTIRQSSYLIQNSMLHFGNDSFSTHVASGFNTKLVSLYSILYKECCGPYWGDRERQKLIESDRGGLKASFNGHEQFKTINLIDPEIIATSILDLLNINHSLNKIETLHIGKEYHIPTLSVVPNHVMPDSFMRGQPINIWGDECFDERNIMQWAKTRECNIFLNKPMNIKYLHSVIQNIKQINYFLSIDDDPQYFNNLQNLGIKLNLLCDNEEQLTDIRVKFFDWQVQHVQHKTKKDVDNIDLLCDNSRYKCSMKVISDGRIYNSRAAWKHDKTGEHNKVIDCPDFWRDLNILRIYNDKQNEK